MWHLAVTYQHESDLMALTNTLTAQNIEFDVREHLGLFEVYVSAPELILGIQQFQHQQFQQKKYAFSLDGLKQTPITTLTLLICLISALITLLGQQFNDFFYIAIINFDPRSWVLYDGLSLIWHSISPIFLHFSIEHLLFNAVMFWYLAARLEHVMGRYWLLLIIFTIAIFSNYAQLFMTGPLFGGMSGVVYGLLGFVFGFQKRFTDLGVNNGIFYFSLAWLLLGMTNIFSLIGLFNMANTAHLSGLIAGFALFAIYYQFNKRHKYEC